MSISVIIPTLNEKDYISDCLKSLLIGLKNFQEYEIIIVDGESDDNTVKIDNPDLNCRLPGMNDRSPYKVIIDTNLSTPLDSSLVKNTTVSPTCSANFGGGNSNSAPCLFVLLPLGIRQ